MRMKSLVAAAAFFLGAPGGAQQHSARLDSVMAAAQASGFSGVVRVERQGQVLLERGYGLANREAGIPFTAGTVVQIGSNTKDFTKVAILQLVEAGRIGLADPLSGFFPAAPADKGAITISQLLEHRAGFPLGLGPDAEQVTRQQLIDNAMRFKLLFAPGERNNYSNTGYALLAAIIEQVSGTSYDQYVRGNILVPIGLRSTGFHLPGFDEMRLARGYSAGGRDEGTLLSRPYAADGPFWNLRGNGGMLSTVGDMHLFYKALFETDKLLKPATRNSAFPADQPVMLAGSDLVSFFLYNREPADGVEIIIASNSAEHKAPQVHRLLAGALGMRLGDRELAGPAGGSVPQRSGVPASPELHAIADDVVGALNSGPGERLRRMVEARFASGPGEPTVDQRLERLGGVNANVGAIEILGVTVGENGSLQIHVRTASEGAAMIMLDIEPSPPHRIRRLGLMVGGD